MSDIGALSQEYANAAELSRSLNDATIMVKRQAFDLPGGASVASDDLAESRQFLATIVAAIADALESTNAAAAAPVWADVLAARLQGKHRGEIAYFVDDLRRLNSALAASAPVGDHEISTLDEIATTAGEETSQVFRRLIRS